MMTGKTILVVCLFLTLTQTAGARCLLLDVIGAGHVSPETHCLTPDDDSRQNSHAEALHLEVSPSNIFLGQTEVLTVNCSLSLSDFTNMSGIMSLILSKSVTNENQEGQFSDLVSINVFSADQITRQSQFDGSVVGQIDKDGVSFIAIEWSNPADDQAGHFRCTVHGMDDLGYPTEVVQTKRVTSKLPNLIWFTEKINILQTQIDHQNSVAKNQSDEINKLVSLTNTQSQIISAQQAQLNNQSVTITDIQEKLHLQGLWIEASNSNQFIISSKYNNHYYLLSKQAWTDSTAAEQICQDYGGYLAQIKNANENQFVNDFIKQHSGIDHILISGTDSQHEGRWTYTGSDTDLVFYDWQLGQPNETPSENCIVMYIGFQWKWGDYLCTRSETETTYKFLCEL